MTPQEKASVLFEALPYLQEFRGKVIVIKYGGAAMENEELIDQVLQDVIYLESVGINPVLVHGGGKAITRAMKDSGIQAEFIDGMRVSDPASMEIIERVLSNEITPGIVDRISRLGGRAKGFSGRQVLRATQMLYRQESTGKVLDLGFVGDITGVKAGPLLETIASERIPVISPLAVDDAGNVYNINADLAAAEIAQALKADKIIYLSDVDGVMQDPKKPETRISSLTLTQIDVLKKDGTISGGMLPKVNSAVECIRAGVKAVHFLDGRMPHALLLEIFTDAGIGTEIIAD